MSIELVICNSLTEVENTIKHRCTGTDYVFRGLPNSEYLLQTRIEAKVKDKKLANNTVKKIIESFDNLIEKNGLTNEIYKVNSPFNKPNYKNNWYLMCQAQHLGIPTMLMDWSLDWRKSLFFTVFDLKNEKASGILWCFDVNGFTYNDDQLDSNSIYLSSPFAYRGQPRILNPSFELGMKGFLAAKRMDYQCGRFLISSLEDNCEPMENKECFKERLTKIMITPECKLDIIKKYCTPQEVPFVLSGLQGVYVENGKWFKKYDHDFFCGWMNEKLLKVVNQVRKNEEFVEINN